MQLQNESVHQLKDFGLNSYESKLWTALLSRGAATAGELSDIANVPRSRSYDVLESLEKKGFIMVKIGKPIRYMAVPPEHVIERVKKRIAEEADERLSVISKIEQSELIDELKLLHNSGAKTIDPLEMSGTIKGRKNLYSRLDYAAKQAESEIIISTTSEGLKRKGDFFRNTFRKAKNRGVKIKILAPMDSVPVSGEFSSLADIRYSPIEGRYWVIDGKQVFFMLSKEAQTPANDSAIWVTSPFFVASFKSLFDQAWNCLKPSKQ
jgi:HTH-type transcriptional regulator, sugar sensing transcriptional regulator